MNLKIQNPHLKVVLSIGGMASIEAFAVVASDPVLRDAFARSAKDLVDASGLDGIDSRTPRCPLCDRDRATLDGRTAHCWLF